MSIDADRRFAEGDAAHQVGGLPPDTGQGDQIVDGIGNPAVETLQGFRQLAEMSRLAPVKTDRIDQAGDPVFRELFEPVDGVGNPEQPLGGERGYLVLGPGGEDSGNEDLEGISGLDGDQVDDRCPGVGDGPGDGLEEEINIDGH